MRTRNNFHNKYSFIVLLGLSLFLLNPSQISATSVIQYQDQQVTEYKQYSGVVVDNQSNESLIFSTISIIDTNISTITNSEGEFLLKVPIDLLDGKILVTTLGYKKKMIPIKQLKKEKNKIRLETSVTKLSEVVFHLPKDAESLVRTMFKNKKRNNSSEHVLMTAFYRETIKKRKKNASLSEAIVNVYKQPYTSLLNDKIKLYKVRKSTDYSRLDTIALKLQGGPFNALFIDIMKYPEYLFSVETFDLYKFSFAPSTTIGERTVYVVKFEPRVPQSRPLYYGKLFIDAQSRALTSAIYNLDVSNKKEAAALFVKKNPKNVFTYPTSVAYRVDYREKDGIWYYSYGNAMLSFKVKRKGKWFNSTYSISSEMAVTDWKKNKAKEKPAFKDRMRHAIIISDEASGFSDPDFWGPYNVIEPDKSIEVAIKKIKRRLLKGTEN